MHEEPKSENGPRAHPLAELLACPQEAANLLNVSSRTIAFGTGEAIFRQGEPCRGLYLVVAGELVRKAERLSTRIVLGQVHVGELIDLAGALGDGRHTCTLASETDGLLLVLPLASLQQTFLAYPPLRMHLLEELAREVSCAYRSGRITREIMARRRGGTRASA